MGHPSIVYFGLNVFVLCQDTVSKLSLLDRMVGRATQSIVDVNKIKCMSLLDSGSMVSNISVATLKSDLTFTTLGKTPKVPFVSSTLSDCCF
jgi:hypothetical protein